MITIIKLWCFTNTWTSLVILQPVGEGKAFPFYVWRYDSSEQKFDIEQV